MPNRNYEAGRRWEWTVMREWKKAGYKVLRTAGSHGDYDVIAVKWGVYPAFIQCKVVQTEAEATRLIDNFLENPPWKGDSYYEQFIQIHIKGDKRLFEGSVS